MTSVRQDEITADPSDDDSGDADSQTTGLYLNLGIGIPVTILCLLLFDPIRRRFPNIFETRRKLNEAREPLDYNGNRVSTPSAPSYRIFGWLLPTLRLDLDTIADTHGLDAALYLRYHRFMLALFSALLVPSLILLPTYYTATDPSTPAADREIGINVFSISNIPKNDPWRFWMVLVMEYLIGGFVCYHLFYHFTLYCRDRRRYRASRHPANYAILVQDVPKDARTSEAVHDYWDRVFPGQISNVFYVHDARRLEKMKTTFWSAVAKREAAEWRLHTINERNQRRIEKRAMRRHLRRRKPPITDTNGQHIPDIERGVDLTINDTPANGTTVVDMEAHNPNAASDNVVPVAVEMDQAMAEIDSAPSIHDANAIDDTGHQRKHCGLIPAWGPRGPPKKPEAAVLYWEKSQRRAWAKVMAYQAQRDDGHFAVTTTAIVVFKSRRSAAIAAQTNFSQKEDEWRVSRAPEPNAINWGALCVPGWSVYFRQAITLLLSTSLTLFWIAPVTIIMTVVNIRDLSKLEIRGTQPFSSLKSLENLSPWMVGILESFLPTIVLSLFLNFIPNFFSFFVSISRITSLAERDRDVRDWNFTFVVFSNFLFVAFAGTLLRELSKILDNPSSTVDILARNIPKQAAFMMNFILFTALTESPRELLQFVRVLKSYIQLKFTAHTQREREEAEVGDTEVDYVGFYSMSQLITLLGLVYCTIQPFITLSCIAYFGVTYVVMKYNICYSLHNEYEDGGRMYGGALYGVWVGLFSHLLTMVGVFGLNRSPAQSVLSIIPVVLASLFLFHCRWSFSRVLEHGSALETQDRVEKLEGCTEDIISEELAETYEHPGWEALPPYDEVEILNGIDVDDVVKAKAKAAYIKDIDNLSDSENEAEEHGPNSEFTLAHKVKQMSNILSDISGDANVEATRMGEEAAVVLPGEEADFHSGDEEEITVDRGRGRQGTRPRN